jgi:glyoxylase-like metal-dependent hydrolase (beta-lactamase superfamily II)
VIEDDDLSGAGDWTRPGVYRCAPDVYRIPLPLPMDGLRAVNVYAIRHGDEITVIDAGWSIPEARDLLASALAELDAGFPDVRRFLVTHIHRDHYTQAVALRREFGMRVALGRGEEQGLVTINDPDQPEGPIMASRLRRAGGEAVVDRRRRTADGRGAHARRRRDPRPHAGPPGVRRRGGGHHVLRRPRAAPDHAVDRAGT